MDENLHEGSELRKRESLFSLTDSVLQDQEWSEITWMRARR